MRLLQPRRVAEIRAQRAEMRRDCIMAWQCLESMSDAGRGTELWARRAENVRQYAMVLGMDPDKLPEMARRLHRAHERSRPCALGRGSRTRD